MREAKEVMNNPLGLGFFRFAMFHLLDVAVLSFVVVAAAAVVVLVVLLGVVVTGGAKSKG